MAELAELQWRIRGLTIGPGTPYWETGANPFALAARADQSGPNAWDHGAWSGPEWAEPKVVPMRIWTITNSAAEWVPAHQKLAAAWRPVGDSAADIELRFARGGREYVLFGRPRMIDPDPRLISGGVSLAQCRFVALDPRVYAGEESTFGPVGLTQFTGGLLVPFTVPFTVDGTLSGGIVNITNEGTAETGVLLRIDGPCPNPRLVIKTSTGATQTLQFDLQIGAGQWLDIDTVARTALLNGLPTSNQFGVSTWGWDLRPLPGDPEGQGTTTTLRFFADRFEPAARLSGRFRSGYW